MTTLHLLLAPTMEPVPANVELVEDYGTVFLVTDTSAIYTEGRHVVVSAEPAAFRSWLSPFDGIWFGKGQPCEQRFEVGHIAKEPPPPGMTCQQHKTSKTA